MFKKAGRGYKRPFCINEKCPNFLPEEKRGGFRKKTEEGEAAQQAEGQEQAQGETKKKTTAKKTAAKKASAKKAPAEEQAEE